MPVGDLVRALAAFDASTMESAVALAARIEALPHLVAGLRLVPEGRARVAALDLRVTIPTMTAVRAFGIRGTASVAEVVTASWWRRPLAVARLVFPSRKMLRRTTPLARRGRSGLVAAYALRPLWMAAGLRAAVRSWRAVSRTGADG